MDTDASNRERNMEKMEDCTEDHENEGYWDSNSFMKSWQNICGEKRGICDGFSLAFVKETNLKMNV